MSDEEMWQIAREKGPGRGGYNSVLLATRGEEVLLGGAATLSIEGICCLEDLYERSEEELSSGG